MKDLIQELAMVDRSVGEGSVPAGPAQVVTLSRRYATTPAQLWDALTDPDRLSRWFLPVEGELSLGGRYAFTGNAGGVIRACEPHRRLLVTWEMGPTGPEDASLVEVVLEEDAQAPGSTVLTLTHRAQTPPEMWDQLGAVGVGWDGALLGLALHVAGGELPSMEDLDRDPAVREFNVASARAWGEAQLAAGTDPEVVEANVAATTAFYVPPQDD
ncbi:SRPBCC family protein [uncultured Serinicoccus sp.]|uniref:SRPBCC family protein n=1 Tax=uncultured Serinicoccus sp. TaxID=735514 RepID=UPI00262372E0|nr:SRPBCC family protein [uncultured Serinicoccus sp.]